MKRIFLMVAVLALVVAACGSTTVEPGNGTDTTSSSTPSGDATETTVPTSSSSDASVSDSSTSSTKAKPEGDAAPDFTLALQPTGEFVLSQEVKPVYMVFWAEW